MLRTTSWLEKYIHAYDVTQMVYNRSPLPQNVVESALEDELASLDKPADFRFEYVGKTALNRTI
jgi:hypothetical protein